jgi:hypothetical protein
MCENLLELGLTSMLAFVLLAGDGELPVGGGLAISDRGGGPSANRPELIKDLLDQLLSKDSAKSKQAFQKLAVIEDALPALRQKLDSKDESTRTCVREVIRENRAYLAKRSLAEALKDPAQTDIDFFVDRQVLAAEAGAIQEESWRATLKLAEEIKKVATKQSQGKYWLPSADEFTTPAYFTDTENKEQDSSDRVTLRVLTNRVTRNAIREALILCRGNVQAKQATGLVLFANGDVTIDSVAHSILVCDGAVEIDTVRSSIVIATGPIRVRQRLGKNAVIPDARASKDAPRFFGPDRLSIRCHEAAEGIQIDEVGKAAPSWTLGLKSGDIVLRCASGAPCSLNAISASLRRELVDRRGLKLEVQRGGKRIEVSVP